MNFCLKCNNLWDLEYTEIYKKYIYSVKPVFFYYNRDLSITALTCPLCQKKTNKNKKIIKKVLT